jgi:hypothetical protein
MKPELIPIRLSHLLGQSGVGAIVRGPDELVVIHDTREWTDRNRDPGGRVIYYVDRARAALKIEQSLREPPIARDLKGGVVDGVCVPVSRFPRWARCPAPKCGRLYRNPWRKSDGGPDAEQPPRCDECKSRPRLEQVTWVLVHPAGFLADVPWYDLAHAESQNPAQRNCRDRDRLRLLEEGARRRLSCVTCQATAAFSGDDRRSFGSERQQPWTRAEHADGSDRRVGFVAPVNDARVYSPVKATALVIPPESRLRKGTAVDRLYRTSEDRRKIDSARAPLARKGAIREIASRYRCSPSDVEEALKEIAAGYPLYGKSFTAGRLLEDEYAAFLEARADQHPDEDLVTYDQSGSWAALATVPEAIKTIRAVVSGVDRLVRIDRLKAVEVFKGFRRCEGLADGPSEPPDSSSPTAPPAPSIPPDIIGQSDWFPAIELYGEGIFLTLDKHRLDQWEMNPAVASRLEPLVARFARTGRESPVPLTARFMLLHTLSHLLMRQIESEAGYPASSLKERVYAAKTDGPDAMAGLLIYVAVPDIAGSLGGLAELADPRRFLGILTRAVEHAHWCSFDPVCREHEGQGPALLNRAACHACALVPDTACEHGNTLLDRGFVQGDDAGLPTYFGLA